jgi:hypothetical protein
VTSNSISATGIDVFITNFDRVDYLLTPADVVEYEFYLKIANPIPQNGGIKLINISGDFAFSAGWSFQNIFDISESSKITYTVSGATLYINNFDAIIAGTIIGIGVKATNPAAANTFTIQISTYRTIASGTSTDIIDVTNPEVSLVIISTYNALSTYTVAATSGTITANALMGSVTLAYSGQGSSGSAVYKITFSKDFSIIGTGAVLLSLNSGANQNLTAVRNSNQEVEITYTSGAGAAAGIVIAASGANGVGAPKYAGDHRVELTIVTSGSDAHKTAYLTVAKQDLNAGSMSVLSYTKDYDHKTVFSVSAYIPYAMEGGSWRMEDNYAHTYIQFSFPTQISGQPIFGMSLGVTPVPNPFPCYAILGLTKYGDSVGDNLLTCTLTAASAVGPTNFVYLKITNYDDIKKEGLITIHIPGIYNPSSQSTAPTLQVDIYRVYRGVTTQVLGNTKSMTNPTTYNIFSNAKNTNGVGGISTNSSPIFAPNTINTTSYLEIKVTAGRAITAGGGFVIFAPALPATSPQYSLLPSQGTVKCKISSTSVTCYSYPLKNMLLIVNIPTGISLNEEITIKIEGCKNAPYVVNLGTKFTMWSYENDFREHENFIF